MSATEPPPLPLRKREAYAAADIDVAVVAESNDTQPSPVSTTATVPHASESAQDASLIDTPPDHVLQRLLGLSAETPAQFAERYKKEREEDDRYLAKLDKYVGPVRLRTDAMASDAAPEARHKPDPSHYKRDGKMDWFGYGMNAFAYHVLPPPQPVVPRPTFEVARLRSSAERLYADAIPMWAPLLTDLGAVIMWQEPVKTALYAMTYTYVTVKSYFTPLILGFLIWKICKKKLATPAILSTSASDSQEEVDRQEAFEFVEEMFADGLAAGGAGAGLSTTAVTEAVASKIREQTKKPKDDGEGDHVEEKKDKKKPSRREKFNAWKDANGPGLIVVLDDLADMHEKASNLCQWRDPKASLQTLAALLVGLLLCTFTPTLILLKGFQVLGGLLMFVIIPIAARQERYDPLSFLLGPAPTDAEYATTILRRRREEHDEELPSVLLKRSATASTISTDAGSTLDKKPRKNVGLESVKSTAKSGAHWLEQGRQIARGEKSLGLEVDGDASNALGSVKIPGMASSVSLMAAYKQGAEPDSQTATFFAQCHSRPGTLFIGPPGLRFAYLVKPKPGSKEEPVDTEDIHLAHSEILEVARTEKKVLTVVVASGFTVETSKKEKISFPFVQNRDQAFNRILAFAE